jgi:hypothetical protein
MGGVLAFSPGGVTFVLPQADSRALRQDVMTPSFAHRQMARAQAEHNPVPPALVQLHFVDAQPNPQITMAEADRLPGTANYFLGKDRSRWRAGVPTYAGIVYQQLYRGIDLHYDGANSQLKSTYLVAPGADPGQIRWYYDGITQAQLDADGNLVLSLPAGSAADSQRPATTLTEAAPLAWQTLDGRQVPVDVRYAVADDGQIGFTLGSYDRGQPLTIDPALSYSVFLGGSAEDYGNDIAVDSSGNAYITGATFSASLAGVNPTNLGSGGDADMYVAKLAPDGQSLLYSTYVGGADYDGGRGIAIDSDGQAYIVGDTGSDDFPPQAAAQSSSTGEGDVFVTVLNASGTALEYSSYLGGSALDQGYSIALGVSGGTTYAYVTGLTHSAQLAGSTPVWLGPPSGTTSYNAFVVRFDPSNSGSSSIGYRTLIGGSTGDAAHGIAVDSSGSAYITGYTTSSNFHTQSAYQGSRASTEDAFVTKLNAAGSAAVYSTYLGGNQNDWGNDIAVDSAGAAYITGYTRSTNLAQGSPAQASLGGELDAFVTKVNPAGTTLGYTTYLGGSEWDSANAIALDAAGNVYVTGATASTGYWDIDPLPGTAGGDIDTFVTKLDGAGTEFLYRTALGGAGIDTGNGIAVDSANNVYVTGDTDSGDFPSAGVLQAYGGNGDAFVAKLGEGLTISITDALGQPVQGLALNGDGWPALNADGGAAANPIYVTVTINNATANHQIYRLTTLFGSTNNQARFHIFASPGLPTCETFGGFSYTETSDSCDIMVLSDTSESLSWGIWVQPSPTSALVVSANLMLNDLVTVVGTAAKRVDVPQAAIHPLVFIHGILGSMPPKNNVLTDQAAITAKLDPFLNSYTPMVINLQMMGYRAMIGGNPMMHQLIISPMHLQHRCLRMPRSFHICRRTKPTWWSIAWAGWSHVPISSV